MLYVSWKTYSKLDTALSLQLSLGPLLNPKAIISEILIIKILRSCYCPAGPLYISPSDAGLPLPPLLLTELPLPQGLPQLSTLASQHCPAFAIPRTTTTLDSKKYIVTTNLLSTTALWSAVAIPSKCDALRTMISSEDELLECHRTRKRDAQEHAR